MKHRRAVLVIPLIVSPSLEAEDIAPQIIRERIACFDTIVEALAKFIAEGMTVGGNATPPPLTHRNV